MILPFSNPIIEEKNRVQKKLFDQANGDIETYREINQKIAKELNETHPELLKKEDKAISE